MAFPYGLIQRPLSFAELLMTRCWAAWAQPGPVDMPTKHLKTYTFLRAFAAAADTFVDVLTTAAYTRFPGKAPADALDELGATYGGLARALRDTTSTYRAYLHAPLNRWATFGTNPGLLAELAHLGYPSAQVCSWRDIVDAGNPTSSFGNITSYFFVAIFWPMPYQVTAGAKWADGVATWKTTGDVWGGYGRTANDIAEIERVIRMVKRGRTSCRYILMANDGTATLDANLRPVGNWTTYPMFEDCERRRPSYAGPNFYNRTFESPT